MEDNLSDHTFDDKVQTHSVDRVDFSISDVVTKTPQKSLEEKGKVNERIINKYKCQTPTRERSNSLNTITNYLSRKRKEQYNTSISPELLPLNKRSSTAKIEGMGELGGILAEIVKMREVNTEQFNLLNKLIIKKSTEQNNNFQN